MNLATAKAEVRERLGETTEEDFWKDAQVLRALNEAQRRFSLEEKWPWLYASYQAADLAQGATSIELIDAVDYSRHFSIALTKVGGDGRIVIPRRITPAQGLTVKQKYAGARSEPRYYYLHRTVRNIYDEGVPNALANIAEMVPAADATYNVEYQFIRVPDELETDEQELDCPRPYQEAIIAYATGLLWLKELNGGGKAQEQFNIYNIVVEQGRNELNGIDLDQTVVWGRTPPEERLEDRFPFVHLPQNIGI